MSWLLDAFEWLQERVEKAKEADIVLTHGTHSRKHTVVWPSGEHTEIDRLRGPKYQNVRTISAFATALKLANDFSLVGDENKSVVYVMLGRITARPNEMVDEDVPDDRILFPFEVHPLVALAGAIPANGAVLSHADLRQTLSAKFGDVQFEPLGLLDLIKTVQFSALSESESEQSRDLDKLGKRLTAKVTGIEALPEKFTAEFHPTTLFPGLTTRKIEFALTPILSEQKFRLVPVAGSLSKAITEAEDELVQHVRTEISAAGVKPAAVLAGYRD